MYSSWMKKGLSVKTGSFRVIGSVVFLVSSFLGASTADAKIKSSFWHTEPQ